MGAETTNETSDTYEVDTEKLRAVQKPDVAKQPESKPEPTPPAPKKPTSQD